jgi:hypothetical protein
LYEQLVTAGLERHLRLIPGELTQREGLDPADAHEVLARHVAVLVNRALRNAGRGTATDTASLARQVELANSIVRAIEELVPDLDHGDGDHLVAPSNDVLLALAPLTAVPDGATRFPRRPEVPLGSSALLVNARDQPRIGTEVQRELESADRVDLLCAFIKWHGVRVLDEHIESLLRRGGRRTGARLDRRARASVRGASRPAQWVTRRSKR